MFDFLKKDKTKLQQATINAQLATIHSRLQLEDATLKSKLFISSPTGIATMFAAGSINGALPSKYNISASTIASLIWKAF
ncbi:hypothetical protein [Colwellia echini]|uniref:Serpin domain-containing protein n=1 Tax=Colwellia echini TaxID=1982103 RepID=A0ABY3MWX8_9GAMM|nr:hypothetical protein [Colwellia echini]TYK65732.1 hypothetical protein CWS31_008765 [Colwellia echini]